MPTVLRVGQFRFHFYSDERNEPPHIHVRTPSGECKFWLAPIRLAKNRGLAGNVLRDIERIIYEHEDFLIKQYNVYHNS
jgi:hypothetical protein